MYVDILYDILYITSEIKQAYDDYSKGRGGGQLFFNQNHTPVRF